MSKFVVAPHFRLQEWVAEEKGHFAAEGLDYEFRELPPDHPIFTNEQYRRTDWKTPPSILSLSNGVRELMILYPDSDPARWWQLQEVTGREEFFQSADDIFLYAVDKQNLLKKGETYLVYPDATIVPDRRIKLARLQYDGNYDPEPGGWRRLCAILQNSCNVALRILPIKLGDDKLGSGHGLGAHVAHLTGTTKFKLSDIARAELKRFVEGGGTLIIDAAGGNSDGGDALRMRASEIDSSEDVAVEVDGLRFRRGLRKQRRGENARQDQS